jgi:glutamate dehydrogenase
LEVLAGLALSTEEYIDLMIFKDGKPSSFYKNYMRDVQDKICENAASEFQCIWCEHARLRGAKSRTLISDELSIKLNSLQTELESSDLSDDVARMIGGVPYDWYRMTAPTSSGYTRCIYGMEDID